MGENKKSQKTRCIQFPQIRFWYKKRNNNNCKNNSQKRESHTKSWGLGLNQLYEEGFLNQVEQTWS